jgi:hypothetical protein
MVPKYVEEVIWLWYLCLTLREELGLRMFENGVQGIIFGAKSEEVTGDWRQHNKLHDLVFFAE